MLRTPGRYSKYFISGEIYVMGDGRVLINMHGFAACLRGVF